MATDRAIANTTAFLHELFPGKDITPATLDAWALYFTDWDDDALHQCAMAASKEPGRKFFPTPGEIAAHRPAPPAIDTDALLSRISSELGRHNPVAGWIYPPAEQVRLRFGNTVADAYITAGAQRCYADSDISRDIARRAFADAITAANRVMPGGLRLPAVTAAPLQLPAETERVSAITPGTTGPLADTVAEVLGTPAQTETPPAESTIPDRPTVTSFCDGCKKLKKVSRYSNPTGGIWWLCQETCAPKPHEIIRNIVQHSPPPADAVPNPAIDQWLDPVPPPDLDVDVPSEELNLAIDQEIARADADHESAMP